MAGRSISFSQPYFPSQFALYSAPFCSAWIHPSGDPGYGAVNCSRGQAHVVLGHARLRGPFVHLCRY